MRTSAVLSHAATRLFGLLGVAAWLLPAVAGGDPVVGRPAPPLVATTLDGETFDLAAQGERVVLVNFWASWCPPCRDEMPLLDGYLRRHRAEGLEVVGMSLDRRGERRDAERAMRPFSYPAALVDGARSNGFGMPRALPVTYVVDRKGLLRAVLLPGKGALTEQALDAAVLPLLAERAAAPVD